MNMPIDGTCWLIDYVTPAERKDGHYKEVSRVLREKFAAEDKAKELLEKNGFKVIKR